ncbi:hypothetical protein G5B47_20485 [Paenibacillus sp. 7124]|uniref:Uncharacterized protein n=1 Tax=Paenibacillus apii TaxID=1850370 RepID=A0A6M1PQZ3_9BACL|nr:hypothetical protein [Paenibacillus apii]NGM84784.1 hypothetical protein [Paenibacillus apii]
MTLFESYQLKKANGEVVDFNQLTLNELKQLHWNEGRFDWEIAELFNVSNRKYNKREGNWGLQEKK